MSSENKRIAIIGAGMTAAACVRALTDQKVSIDVFEKSRGAGGRMATRRLDDVITADHGAQYFTARSDPFKQAVREWQEAGVISNWNVHDGRDCFAGTPAMNSPVKHVMRDVNMHPSTHVTHVERTDDMWILHTSGGLFGPYDYIVCTVPSPQVPAIMEAAVPDLIDAVNAVTIAPCWALMLVFKEALDADQTHWRGEDSIVSWIARNSSKAGRDFNGDSWTVHATPQWSQQHLELKPEQASERLYDQFKTIINLNGSDKPVIQTAHRWRYAQTIAPLGRAYLADATETLFIGGDWCLGARVENAFDSGWAIGNALKAKVN